MPDYTPETDPAYGICSPKDDELAMARALNRELRLAKSQKDDERCDEIDKQLKQVGSRSSGVPAGAQTRGTKPRLVTVNAIAPRPEVGTANPFQPDRPGEPAPTPRIVEIAADAPLREGALELDGNLPDPNSVAMAIDAEKVAKRTTKAKKDAKQESDSPDETPEDERTAIVSDDVVDTREKMHLVSDDVVDTREKMHLVSDDVVDTREKMHLGAQTRAKRGK